MDWGEILARGFFWSWSVLNGKPGGEDEAQLFLALNFLGKFVFELGLLNMFSVR